MATFTMCSLPRRPIDHCRFQLCAGDQSPQPADSGARVNDRGPFHDSRLIDLSYGAALALGFAESGTAPVRVEAVTPPGHEPQQRSAAERYRYLQLGAFKSLQTAERVSQEAADRQGWEYPMAITAVDVRGSAFIGTGRSFR
ncbi:MAG: hypothetical protein CM15mP74_25190 [Halieaceae bacterium]|nr:MAG: hypothetical protein CM15mP74_25190 [Halieaceae bacterium]